jgi:endonuclease/exonuclease/phosphatase family metal-dependent hydrolase
LRVASFNLESLDLKLRDTRPLGVRITMLRPELERAEADILCLQEVNGQRVEGQHDRVLAALDQLLESTRYAGFHRAVSRAPGSHEIADVHNLVTLSRFPIRSVRSIRHDFVPPVTYTTVTSKPPASTSENLTFDRPVLACEIELAPERLLTVVNCHLRAPLASPITGQKQAPFVWNSISGWAEGYCLSSIKRNAQALEVRLLVDSIQASGADAEILLCGDFNAEDTETPVRILIGAEQDTGNGLLAARSLIVLDRGIPADRRFSIIHHGRPQMLDHILCSRSMYGRFKSLQIFNEVLGDEAVGFARIDRPAGSFHACLVAEFS